MEQQAAGFLTFGQRNNKDSSKSTQQQYFDKFSSNNNQQQMPMQNMGAFLPSPVNEQTNADANSFSL